MEDAKRAWRIDLDCQKPARNAGKGRGAPRNEGQKSTARRSVPTFATRHRSLPAISGGRRLHRGDHEPQLLKTDLPHREH